MTTTINAASTGLVSSADSSTALAFQTAGTTAMTINSSQQVGIGNISPTTTLGVTGTAYVTGNITAGGNIAATYFVGNGSALTGVAGVPTTVVNGTTNFTLAASGNANITVAGTANVAVFSTTGVVLTGNATANNFIATTIVSAASHTGTLVSVTGNVNGGNLVTAGLLSVNSGNSSGTVIVNAGGNAVGNIGSATTYFNRLFAQATTALYADLAEMYATDAKYEPGTVLVFGGNQEVTISTVAHDHRVAGVVSTNPAHIMNSGLQAEHTVEVALIGRVPVSVIGNISAGDRVVTSNRAGVAEALDMSRYQPGVIIGKALQDYSGNGVGVIEVVVGRL